MFQVIRAWVAQTNLAHHRTSFLKTFCNCRLWRRHLFCKCYIFQSIPSKSLNGSLQNFNTWRVSVANGTIRRDFWGIGPRKHLGPKKLPIFDDFATQWQTWMRLSPAWNLQRQSANGFKNYKGSPTMSQNFVNFGPLTAKNGIVFLPTIRKFCVFFIAGEPTVTITTMEFTTS